MISPNPESKLKNQARTRRYPNEEAHEPLDLANKVAVPWLYGWIWGSYAPPIFVRSLHLYFSYKYLQIQGTTPADS